MDPRNKSVLKQISVILIDVLTLAVGKRCLEEIPHMIIEDEGTGYVENPDILVFYGEHSKK
jgi:hypothetical protein